MNQWYFVWRESVGRKFFSYFVFSDFIEHCEKLICIPCHSLLSLSLVVCALPTALRVEVVCRKSLFPTFNLRYLSALCLRGFARRPALVSANDQHEPRRHRALRKNDRRYSASVSMALLYVFLSFRIFWT